MTFQELPVFLLKRFLAVVFLLVGDVIANGFDVGLGNGESPVARLPCEMGKLISLRFNPSRRMLFDILHGLADGDGPGKVEEDVNVVFDGIDEHRRTTKILEHRRHVGMQRISDGIMENSFAVLRAENEVDVKAGEGLGHGVKRPFRAGCLFCVSFPGRCPGLALKGAVGAGKSVLAALGLDLELLSRGIIGNAVRAKRVAIRRNAEKLKN